MKYLYIIAFSLILCFSCYAEERILNILENSEWEIQSENEKERIIFTKDSLYTITDYYRINRIVKNSKPYYLSSEIPDKFNSNFVGKKTDGQYIITFNQKTQCIDWCEIIKNANDSLVLFYKKIPYNVGGADTTFIYKRIK